MRLPTLLLLPLILICVPRIATADATAVTLEDGTEVPITRYPGADGDRVLWIPAEYGLRPAHPQLAAALADEGPEVWLADLHGAWFLAPGRTAYDSIPVGAVAELIERSRPEGGRLYLLSAGRGAALVLRAAHRWRLDHPHAPPLGGVLALHPNLLAATPEPGKPARYLPIADATNLPIVIFQPADSAKRWHLTELVEHLGGGGATVYSRLIANVSDGYQSREEPYPRELEARRRLPRQIRGALTLLDRHNREPRTALPLAEARDAGEPSRSPSAGLQPYPDAPPAPPLALGDLEGAPARLADYRGQVVLLNFWATWCPPCVKEIPSLGRLALEMSGEPFAVIGVDMGESRETVEDFLLKVPADYRVLLDPDGAAVDPWKLRAFPTTFLIDREGRIRYAYFGGLEWDGPEVVETVRKLLK